MSTKAPGNTDQTPVEEIHDLLEKCLIEAYLNGKGYTLETLENLPEEDHHQLMKEASTYASGKLAEVEIKARFVQDLREAYTSSGE